MRTHSKTFSFILTRRLTMTFDSGGGGREGGSASPQCGCSADTDLTTFFFFFLVPLNESLPTTTTYVAHIVMISDLCICVDRPFETWLSLTDDLNCLLFTLFACQSFMLLLFRSRSASPLRHSFFFVLLFFFYTPHNNTIQYNNNKSQVASATGHFQKAP